MNVNGVRTFRWDGKRCSHHLREECWWKSGFVATRWVSSWVKCVGTVLSNVGHGTRLTVGTCGHWWYGPWILWHLRRCCWLILAPCRQQTCGLTLTERAHEVLWFESRRENGVITLMHINMVAERVWSHAWWWIVMVAGAVALILPLNGFNLIRAKQNLHMRWTKVCRRTDGITTAERTVRRVKEGTFAVLLQRTRWKVVVRLYAMLLLSAKRPRPPGRRENTLWKTIRSTIQRANSPFWSNGWTSPNFSARSIKTSSIWQERITRYLSRVINSSREGIWKGDILTADLEHLENWMHQTFILEDLTRKKYG